MEILSLFDYLGRPAGSELGNKVNKEAQRTGVSYRTKQITTPKYKGNIHCYPRNFLDLYFKNRQGNGTYNDELPF
jgi:hypothetical protein